MSSGFVPAGSESKSGAAGDEWTRAKQQVDASRKVKPSDAGTQEGGKSLYEHLQANKAAKQDAFEEFSRLKNQFRPLDDSEIEFLDSVRSRERAQEAAVRRETEEQLDAFRKEREAAGRAALEADSQDIARDTAESPENTLWISTKKRRRENSSHQAEGSKIRRTSQSKSDDSELKLSDPSSVETKVQKLKSEEANKTLPTADVGVRPPAKAVSSSPPLAGLGLDAYSSDDEDG